MKKLLLTITALVGCWTSFAQQAESEDLGNTPEFTIIPRLEGTFNIPARSGGEGESGFHMGATSLYTLFEGNLGEHFSYSVCNHWISTDPGSLYKNTFYSNNVSWVDWANITYSAGPVSFTLGKDCLAIGTYEMDAYDVDSYNDLSSQFWHNVAYYQWGAKIALTTQNESTLAFQFATSPFGERPFKSKLFSYSLYWTGEYGCFSPIWSQSMMEWDRGRFISVTALGNRFTISDSVGIDLDIMNRATSFKRFFDQEMTMSLRVNYSPCEKVSLFAKAGYEFAHNINAEDGTGDYFGWGAAYALDGDSPADYITYTGVKGNPGIVPDGITKDYCFYGMGVQYYPLSGSKDLRLHAVIAANNYAKAFSMTVGATYYFNLTRKLLKR